MRKILIVSNTSFSLYNFRYNLAKTLKEKGYNVYLSAPEDEYSEELEKEFNFIPLKNLDRKGKNPIKDLSFFVELLYIYKKFKPDLVLHYTIKPNIYGSLACAFLNIPSIATVTGLGYVFTQNNKFIQNLVKFLYKEAFRKVNYVVFQNKSDMEEFIKNGILSSQKAVLIEGSGIDIEKFNPDFCKDFSKKEYFTFIMISRLLWDKGIKEYLEAAKFLKKRYKKVKFLLLGSFDKGNPSAVPEEFIYKYHKEGVIEYLGFSNDVRPYICKSDVVVLPSYREGLPRVLLEAMAMGKPIITTNAPGCRDVVIDNYNGYIVEVKNAKSLINAMEKCLLMDREKLRTMGNNGKKLVQERFSDNIIINKYLKLIEKILKGRIM